MKFALNQLKIEQLVGYFNEGVIDLTPPFQRGRVWTLKLRQGLLKNILQGKPVPAIFLYKKPEGPKNTYVILDGKQRLESILLYIGAERDDLKISTWDSYIFGKEREKLGFKTNIGGKNKGVSDLQDGEVVKLRDYSLSVIEIDFDEETTLDEIIQLFVDINQSGVKVTRFDIVKALYLNDPFLKQVFALIGLSQTRKKDKYPKEKNTATSYVLKRLDIVKRLDDPQNKIDLMWERLSEIALYTATGQHRKPSDILKEFISRKARQSRLSSEQLRRFRTAFDTAKLLHGEPGFSATRWATDHTHFYILIASMIDNLKAKPGELPLVSAPNAKELAAKLIRFDEVLTTVSNVGRISGVSPKAALKIRQYSQLSQKQTTDVLKRAQRVALLKEIIELL